MLWRYNGKLALIWNFLKCQAGIQNTLVLVNNSYHYFYQWKFRPITQKVNKTQLKPCVFAIQTLTAFKYTKSSEVKPKKNKHENGANFFPPLGQSKKSQKRKALVSVESRKGGKKKKCGIVYPFAAETGGSNATSLRHPNSFKLRGTES